MNWRRSPLLVWSSAVSFFFLLTFVLILIPSQKGSKILESAKIIQLKNKETTALPADFGSLGDLVPFSGGIEPMSADMRLGLEEHTPEFRGADWLRSQSTDQFTIQIMAARELDSIKNFLDERPDRGQYTYFQSQREDGLWYVLVTGKYNSLEQARGVAESLEIGTQNHPYPVAFQVYQATIPVETEEPPEEAAAATSAEENHSK